MNREMERILDEIGVVARRPAPEPAPKRETAPAWRPSYPGEEPPF